MKTLDTTLAATLLVTAIALGGCARSAETTPAPEEAQPSAQPDEAVQLEPAYPKDVSAEGLSETDEAQHRELGEHTHEDGATHTHEDGATHTHEVEDEHGDGGDDHEHGDDGHSH
jgi:hypothetical protein